MKISPHESYHVPYTPILTDAYSQNRYLDPDPLLLVSAPGSNDERTERNSRFHALNQAIVQLVRLFFDHPLGSCNVNIRGAD